MTERAPPATRTSLLSLRGASFGYGGKAVVAGVDLELGTGSFLGVLGPNGAGKTTLLRGLLGLLAPLSGSVRREGVVFGYVPQREGLDAVYPFTVEEVVRMGAYGRLTGWRRVGRDDRRLADELLDRVGLLARRRQGFARLSGGQRQRTLIARALTARPNVLVLDEPTTGVDLPTQELIVELLNELNRDTGLAIVLVSHQPEITRLVHEALWVADGRAHRRTPAEVRAASERLGPRLRRDAAGRGD